MTVYLKGRIIDSVSDSALEDGLLIIEGNKIQYAGPAAGVEIPRDAEVIAVNDGTIMPGFIDCHTHLTGVHSVGGKGDRAPMGDLVLGAAHEINILLDAGFTSLRDMSRPGLYLSRAVERGNVRGPRIMPGGCVLGITSGHTDFGAGMSPEHINENSLTSYLMDGVEGCLKGVRTQFRQGAKFIKLCATGGVSSPVDGVNDVQFSPQELRVIVDEAKRHGTYVAAHCTGNEGAYQSLLAGVECIEHGVMLTQREIDLMAQMDATLVTTLYIALEVANMPGLPDYLKEKAASCAETNLRTIEMARKAGIRIALGTDFSNSANTPYAQNGREFAAMTRAGMTALEAIRAGTINAAYLLGMEDEIGTLEKDKLADVVVVKGNPLEDINVLTHKDNVKAVLKNGVMEKKII